MDIATTDDDPVEVYLALGSNLGNREHYLGLAWERFSDPRWFACARRSRWFETAPVGGPSGQDPFLNGILSARTHLSPYAILRIIQDVERQAGRCRDVHWGPRTLDVDLLSYGDMVLDTEALELPHPRLHERDFVLNPLCSLNPDWVHPTLGVTAEVLLERYNERSKPDAA